MEGTGKSDTDDPENEDLLLKYTVTTYVDEGFHSVTLTPFLFCVPYFFTVTRDNFMDYSDDFVSLTR